MEIHIHQEELARMVEQLQGAIEERSQAQLGLKIEGQNLFLSIIDKSMAAYSVQNSSKIEEEGLAFVPAKLFIDIIREFPKGVVHLKTEKASLVVMGGPSQEICMKLPLIEEVVWREEPDFGGDVQKAILPCGQFAYMIEQVQFCINPESPRNYGTVGYLHKLDEKTLRLVGSDGFRLSCCDIICEMPESFLEKGVCLSKKALAELYRMCQKGQEFIELSISPDQRMISAKLEGHVIFFLLSTVKYPNYQGVIPQKLPHNADLGRAFLQNVTKRILLAADKMKSLQLNFSSQCLALYAKNIGATEGRESFVLEGYHGPTCSLAVNGRYLSDVFGAAVSDMMEIQFGDNDKPIIVLPKHEPKQCNSQHILVPLREEN